ncbi:MAG: Clp protease N-terminal domain-containing protein [Candidatus Obscuribacterales bacterium]
MDSSKFSYQALQAMSRAQQEARRLRRKFVGTEELLVALTDPASAVYNLLLEFDITVERLRSVLIPSSETSADLSNYFEFNKESLPFKSDAENALKQAIEAAGAGTAETQHIMWGLLSEDTMAGNLLHQLGVDQKKLELEVFEMLDFKDAKDSEEGPLDPGTLEPPPRPAGSLKNKYKDTPHEDIDFDKRTPSNKANAFAPRPPKVSSWFATQAQSAMARAFDESESLGSILGTEHILYGLVCNGTECTTRTFEYTKVNAASVRQQIRSLEASMATESGQTIHTSAVTLLEQSRAVMSQCCQEKIDCEHLLIAMLHNSDSMAYNILQNLSVDTRVLKEVLLFWMNRCGEVQGRRSVIGRIDYARTKELKSDDQR